MKKLIVRALLTIGGLVAILYAAGAPGIARR
jgi:hypothetical protein